MSEYNKTIIYKIVCRDSAIKECYVGHTTNFAKRKQAHKRDSKTQTCYVYEFIRDHGGWDNWHMVMVEEFPCDNRLQACARERHWIETLNAELNSRVPPTGLTQLEYRKQYCAGHRDKVNESSKRYYAEHREQRKQYYAENMDKCKERAKQYYTENKESISERHKQRVCCILCKCELSRAALPRHYTKMHNM